MRNIGKEIKDVGTLMIVIGCIMLSAIIFALFIKNANSVIVWIVNNHTLFLAVGGLSLNLLGIICRSVGKKKEIKYSLDKKFGK